MSEVMVFVVIGAISGSIGTFFAVRKFLHWWRPIRIRIGIGFGPDKILATVTNLTNEEQVLTGCSARCVRRLSPGELFWTFFKGPWTYSQFRLIYRILWHSGTSFALMGQTPIRLAAKEQRELVHALSWGHPFTQFLTRDIQVAARLSDGRFFWSDRIEIPNRWRLHLPS